MTYSLDSGSDIATVSDNTMNLEVSSGIGEHTIHVKAWGDTGAVCVTDVAVKVTGADGAEALPSNAASVGSIQAIRSWIAGHDAATHGSSYGSTALVSTPSRGGSSRRFETHFTNGGGERYHVDLGDDATATNFVYDAWIYIAGSASGIGRLEMDLNQVMANGETAIFGFQCDAASGRWDYTANRGSAKHYSDLWVPSRASCDPRSWSVNTWHHVQISYSRNDSGAVTYKTIALDGRSTTLNATVFSAFELHWPRMMIVNFQVGGYGSSGLSTVFVDDLTIQRW
jgi:hypothetical protein